MIDAPLSTYRGAEQFDRPVHRATITSHTFWVLFAIEGCIVAGFLLLVIHFLTPARVPLASAHDYATVHEAIQSRLNGVVSDPLIDVAPGVTVRLSNLRGFALNGVTYYYYVEGEQGFDPLSRGVVSRQDIEVVLYDADGPAPLTIYYIIGKNRARGI